MKKLVWLGLLTLSFAGCDKFELSPNQSFDNQTPRNLNQKNIDRLLSKPIQNKRIKIAFVGDSQRYYDASEAFVHKVNSMNDIDFVILAGDISDFGLRREFEWVNDIFSKLNTPYIAVIGNHDFQGLGEDAFKRMFGPYNFSFNYKGVKFVFHDTNGREHQFNEHVPDLGWLSSQLQTGPEAQYLVPVSHVQPYHDDFTKALEYPYARLMAERKVLVSLHGHDHITRDFYPYNDSIRYINSNALDKHTFLLLEIENGHLQKTLIPY